MPVNTKGGNKTKKQKRNWGRYEAIDRLQNGQMFGTVTQKNGTHFTILCSDNVKRNAPLTNTIKKGPRLHEGTFVAVSLRDFEKNQENCDILGVANPPNNIVELFRKLDPSRGNTNDVEFGDSDNEFEEEQEEKKYNNKPVQLANGICYTNYIDYPSNSEDEEEYEEEPEKEVSKAVVGVAGIAVTEVKEESGLEEIEEIKDIRQENKKDSKSKLSSSKQKLIDNFMDDDSGDESDGSVDFDKL